MHKNLKKTHQIKEHHAIKEITPLHKMSTVKMKNDVAALILVGGYSSRMQSEDKEQNLKALLHFNKKNSLIMHAIRLFQKSGITKIYVVLGYESARIEAHILDVEKKMQDKKMSLEKLQNVHHEAQQTKNIHQSPENVEKDTEKKYTPCRIVINNRYDEGMYSSVCAGIAEIRKDEDIQASFIFPVDAALVHKKTIQAMLTSFAQYTTSSILIPTFTGKCGHPPLIGQAHFQNILHYEKDFLNKNTHHDALCKDIAFRGLQGYFASFLDTNSQKKFFQGKAPSCYQQNEIKTQTSLELECTEQSHVYHNRADHVQEPVLAFLPLADEGILCDIDTMQEYESAQDFLYLTKKRKSLSLLESWHILTHNHLTDRIIKHSYKVALGALRLYLRLQKAHHKENTDVLACLCAALLHDICRLEKHHCHVGATYIKSLGYKDIATIIGAHTNLPLEVIKELDDFIHKNSHQQIKRDVFDYEKSIQRKKTTEQNLSQKPIPQNLKNIPYIKNEKREYKHSIKKIDSSIIAILCVHLSDKFYGGDEFIGMHERFSRIKERYCHDKEALKAIGQREEIAQKVAYWFFTETGITGEKCAQCPTAHPFEATLHSIYKDYFLTI